MSDMQRSPTLADLIRQFRKSANISQATLAERVGVTDGAIGNVERGKRSLAIDTLDRVANALDLDDAERRMLAEAAGRHAAQSEQQRLLRTKGLGTIEAVPPGESLLVEAYRLLPAARQRQVLGDLLAEVRRTLDLELATAADAPDAGLGSTPSPAKRPSPEPNE